jgi:H+-translocating NAD(P) transhydrogenase subunit alpha
MSFAYVYVLALAAFTGWEVVSKVPVILHTPLMSGSNFVHGIVLVGAMAALGFADPHDPLQIAVGALAVFFGAANAVGGFVVTERMLAMFRPKAAPKAEPK